MHGALWMPRYEGRERGRSVANCGRRVYSTARTSPTISLSTDKTDIQKKEKETRKTKNWPDKLNFTRVDPTAVVLLPGFNGSVFGWLDYLHDNTRNLMVEYSTEADCLELGTRQV
jgi:hypothetical protein